MLFFLSIPIEVALAFSGLNLLYQTLVLLAIVGPLAILLGMWVRRAGAH